MNLNSDQIQFGLELHVQDLVESKIVFFGYRLQTLFRFYNMFGLVILIHVDVVTLFKIHFESKLVLDSVNNNLVYILSKQN